MGERPDPARPEVASPSGPAPSAKATRAGPDVELDIRHEACPYTFLRAKLALEGMAPGAVLRLVLGNEASARDVPKSLTDAGHAVLAAEAVGPGLWAVVVRKGA